MKLQRLMAIALLWQFSKRAKEEDKPTLANKFSEEGIDILRRGALES